MRAHIKAISYEVPEDTLTNEELFASFPELSENRNIAKFGVNVRHLARASVTASDLAVGAAKRLFAEHDIRPAEIEFVLYCSQETDYYLPATACVIQERLGLPQAVGALDFSMGCSGYVYGLSLAKGLIEATGLRNILLLTASTLTKKIHDRDRSSRVVFGDGASATLVGSRTDGGIGAFVFGTDGSGADKIIVRDGGERNPLNRDSYVDQVDEYGNVTNPSTFYMDGPAIFNFTVNRVPRMIRELLEKSNLVVEDIDLFVLHQANAFMIETIRKKVRVPEQKFVNDSTYGNTVSSTIPIALCECLRSGRATAGDKILLAGFGVGLSWAATIVEL